MVEDEHVSQSEVEAGFDVEDFREPPGSPSIFRCPECGGAMWDLVDGDLGAYACHVGHTYSADSMVTEQDNAVERALWNAAVMLDEKAALSTRLSERMLGRGHERSGSRFADRAREASQQAAVIRRLLEQRLADEPAD